MTGSNSGVGGPARRWRGADTEVIEVWEDRDLFWRWRYRASGDGAKIDSARNYESREAATEAAALSYPGLTIRRLRRRLPRRSKPPAGAGRFLLLVLLVALIGLAIVGALTVTALVIVVAVMRKLRRIR
jgi:hypothetical protein